MLRAPPSPDGVWGLWKPASSHLLPSASERRLLDAVPKPCRAWGAVPVCVSSGNCPLHLKSIAQQHHTQHKPFYRHGVCSFVPPYPRTAAPTKTITGCTMPAFCGVAATVSRQQKRHPNAEGQGVEDTTFRSDVPCRTVLLPSHRACEGCCVLGAAYPFLESRALPRVLTFPGSRKQTNKKSNIRSDVCCVPHVRDAGSHPGWKGQVEMAEKSRRQSCSWPVIKWLWAVIVQQTFARLLFKCRLLRTPCQWQG